MPSIPNPPRRCWPDSATSPERAIVNSQGREPLDQNAPMNPSPRQGAKVCRPFRAPVSPAIGIQGLAPLAGDRRPFGTEDASTLGDGGDRTAEGGAERTTSDGGILAP